MNQQLGVEMNQQLGVVINRDLGFVTRNHRISYQISFQYMNKSQIEKMYKLYVDHAGFDDFYETIKNKSWTPMKLENYILNQNLSKISDL